MIDHMIVFTIGLAVSCLLTPMVRRLCYRFGILDMPNPEKLHRVAMPRVGGLAIFAGFISAVIYILIRGIFVTDQIYMIISAAMLMVILGLYDDIKGCSPAIKFSVQTVAAMILIWSGVRVGVLPVFLSIPVTIFWIVGITNAVNLQDGMDGLAAGMACLAGIVFSAIGMVQQNTLLIFMSVALSASCLGFLRYNFFPASIFMGDTGSMFIGFMLAAFGVISTMNAGSLINLFAPVLVLGAPIFDTFLAMARRLASHEQIFKADRGHLYDLMIDSQRLSYAQVVISAYVITMLLGAGGLCLM